MFGFKNAEMTGFKCFFSCGGKQEKSIYGMVIMFGGKVGFGTGCAI